MIRYFAAHPTAANLLMLVFLVLGLVALPTLKRETFPEFATQEVEIRVPYPGASAEDVEEAVCQRLEDAIDGIEGVEETRCVALEGLGVAVARMRDEFKIDRFLDDVKTEVEAIDNFPEQVELPVIKQLGRTDLVVSIAVTGRMAITDLKAYAEQLKDRLQQLPTISLVTIEGFSQRQLRVYVPERVLQQYGLSISDVADAISRQSIDLPSGSVQTHDQELLVRFTDQRRSPQELGQLIVVGAQGKTGEIRLNDIATITDHFELDEDKVLFNGRRAAILKITKTKSEDTLTVMEAVRAFLKQERQLIPPGVSLDLTQDISSIVQDRLQLLLKNGWQGLVLVFLVMWLFFQLRYSFWVAMGLPVSFLGGLFFMTLIGYSINMITMVALLISLGLLMDDAIVISENIATQVHRGKNALTAAVEGVMQVAPGVLAAFLTTVAVFGPLAFLAGDMGKVLKVLPVVLILVLLVSLVEAFLILPHHLCHALAHGPHFSGRRFRLAFDRGLERFRDHVLGRTVDAVVNQRYLFAGTVVAVFLVSIGMVAGGYLKFRAFPDIEGDTLEARILLPQGTPLWRTETVVDQLTGALERVDEALTPLQPGGQRLVKNVSVRFNQNPDAHEAGPHIATVAVDLLTAEMRQGHLDDVIHRWRTETGILPDVISVTFKEPQIGPAGLPIEIRLQGMHLDELKAAALELQDWLGRYRGVFNLRDDLRPGKPELRLRLREGALALGLDASTIATQLRAAFHGVTAAEIQVGPESFEIEVQLSELDQNTLDNLEYFPIITVEQEHIPLRSVAEIELDRGYARIQRINSLRTVTIEGDVDSRIANIAEIIRDTQTRFLPELQHKYPGVQITLEGQSKESEKTGVSLRRGFLVGLVGIFVLLSFLFRSYIEPLVVMTTIPLSLIGVIWGHLLLGLELSMPSMMGFASLAGVVVNDSILLVDFLKRRAYEGLSIPEAAKRASRERFRAVLLTSLTTIAGLLPLLSEKSLQAQVLIPLVTSLVFGLLAATLLVLLVVPALFSILDDLGLTAASPDRAGYGQIPTQEEV
jgi:HAE1 family hydrophobic/amphiphilic exporter-1